MKFYLRTPNVGLIATIVFTACCAPVMAGQKDIISASYVDKGRLMIFSAGREFLFDAQDYGTLELRRDKLVDQLKKFIEKFGLPIVEEFEIDKIEFSFGREINTGGYYIYARLPWEKTIGSLHLNIEIPFNKDCEIMEVMVIEGEAAVEIMESYRGLLAYRELSVRAALKLDKTIKKYTEDRE